MPAGPDDPGQLAAVLEPARVVHGAGVADQQGTGVPVRHGLLFGQGLGNVPGGSESDVAVRIHQARQDPAVQHNVGGNGRLLERQPAVDGPKAVPFLVRGGEHGPAEFDDASHGSSLVRRAAAADLNAV